MLAIDFRSLLLIGRLYIFKLVLILKNVVYFQEKEHLLKMYVPLLLNAPAQFGKIRRLFKIFFVPDSIRL